MTPEQIIDAMGRCVVDPEGKSRCDGCPYNESGAYCLNRLKHDAHQLMKQLIGGSYINGLEAMRQAYMDIYRMTANDRAKYFGFAVVPEVVKFNGPSRIMAGVQEWREAREKLDVLEKAERLKNLIVEFGVDELYKAVCELKEQEERADDHTANPAGRGE